RSARGPSIRRPTETTSPVTVYYPTSHAPGEGTVIRTASVFVLLAVCATPGRAAEPVPRTQRVGETTYFRLEFPIPNGTAVPAALRQAVDKIPLDDLAWQPRLVPKDGRAAAVVWRAVNARALD